MRHITQKVYSGKTKDLFKIIPRSLEGKGFLPDEDLYILHFKDNVLGRRGVPDSGGNEIVGVSRGKGISACALTSFFMSYLKKNGIPTHFVQKLNSRDILIRRADKIPIEFILRNYAYGSYLRYHPSVKPLTRFKKPIIEYTLKSDESDDPIMSLTQTLRFVSRSELNKINGIIRRINALIMKLCRLRGILLVDFKVEFGRFKNASSDEEKIVLIDDFSTDTARFFLEKRKCPLSHKKLSALFNL